MKSPSRKTQPDSETPAPPLPMFYREPKPVSSVEHASWRLKAGDYGFAASTAFVPVVIGEMTAAARNYPLVFAGKDATPLAIMGLEQGNLFVEDGRWRPDTYVPAYVRRYPFGFLATRDPDGFVLALDVGSDRIVREGGDGDPLFDAGAPTPMLRDALQFCDAFQREAEATQAFGEALQAQDLLIERRADATLASGRKLVLEGFKVIDGEAFQNLPDDVVVSWHRKGWLALANSHLSSLDRFSDLLIRQQARGGPEDRTAAE